MTFEDVTVILIDDEASDRDLLAHMLRQLGIQCVVMQNADFVAAVERMDAPAMIIIDLQMPDLSGYDLIATIQEQAHLASVPIVAYTSYLNEMATARKQGFHSFLGKPLSSTRLPQQIARILRGEQVWEVR